MIDEPKSPEMACEATPPSSSPNKDDVEEVKSPQMKPLTAKQLEKLERRHQREKEQLERQRRKELELVEKEKRRLARENERLEKLAKKQEEQQERQKRKYEEHLERQAKRQKLEEEKALKRQKLEEEKSLKRKKAEEEKAAKLVKIEEEKTRKLKEKEAKEKSQTRISGFFSVNKPIKKSLDEKQVSDYEISFLKFHVKPNCVIESRYKGNESTRFDDIFYQNKDAAVSWNFTKRASTVDFDKKIDTAEMIMSEIGKLSGEQLQQRICQLPVRYIHFYENNKPPYCGTFTRQGLKAIAPFDKIDTIDYDYDSDFEDEEGEAVDEEDEDDEEDEEEDEDDEFIEKSEPERVRNQVKGSLETRIETGPFESMKVEILLPTKAEVLPQEEVQKLSTETQVLPEETTKLPKEVQIMPINPFKDYWNKSTEIIEAPSFTVKHNSPLLLVTEKPQSTNVLVGRKKAGIKNQEDVAKLKQFIGENSSLTLQGMIDLISQKLPNYKKIQIRTTIMEVAEKRGAGSAKRWTVKARL